MPLVVDIAGRDLVFDTDAAGRLRVAIGGATGTLTPAQCSELVALARAALRAGQPGLDLGDVAAPVPRPESTAEAASPAAPAASRAVPSVEDLERAVRELKDATRGQRRLAL